MRSLAVVVLVLLAACSKDKDDKPRPTTTATGTGTAAAPPVAAGKLTCDELVPPAMREKHFAGHDLNESGPLVASLVAVTCAFSPPGKAEVVTVVATCHADWSPGVWDATEVELRKQTTGATDVAIGKGGYSGTFAGGPHLHAVDDDTPCAVDVHGDADREAIGREAIAALTSAALSS